MLNISYFMLMLTFLHVFNTPYSKVEESFSIQAVHDLLHHRTNLSHFDHNEYPGVVPRSFMGPLLIAVCISPIFALSHFVDISKFNLLILCRCTLGILTWFAFMKFQRSIAFCTKKPILAKLTMALTLSQFHFLFYSSRTLPNTFALIFVLLGISSWLRNEWKKFIGYSAFVIIIFRAELSILMGFLLFISLAKKVISIKGLVKWSLPAGFCALALTIVLDSFFWQRWVWPEGEVLYYNTALNRSSQWGTSPFFWYLYSAIPRAMLLSTVFIPIGMCFSQHGELQQLSVASLLYVFMYSFLPHKELRFIVYVFPVFNATAAVGILQILHWLRKHIRLRKLFTVSLACMYIGNVSATILLSYISHYNYPGGEAFHQVHSFGSQQRNLSVHICNLAAQTGVTRFGEAHSHWRYSKDETVQYPNRLYGMIFDYMVVEFPCVETAGFHKKSVINGYDSISTQSAFPFFVINIKEKLCVMNYVSRK